MRFMRTSEIRKQYLDFFKEKGHVIVPSASIVPENDPTTLFTGSGMQPMLQYFLGTPHPLGKRVADSQKSFRAQDIEEIGDNRHTSCFEMLGNWSFGDYFKNEQIPWMFEFLTERLKLNPQNIYFTCFRGNEELGIPRDTQAAELWQKLLKEKGITHGIQDFPERDGMKDGSRIFYYDEKKNWWSRVGAPKNMPEGEPGGPDTEMFFDFGVHHNFHENSEWKNEPCHVNCDCGRFMEIGNNVFMQYLKTDKGFEPLPAPNVDFGGGLERLTAAVQNLPDIFCIDAYAPAASALEKYTHKKYASDPETTRRFRIILDHIKAAAFIIGDGVMPSNTDQGYVLRRLIRRSITSGRKLDLKDGVLGEIGKAFIEVYRDQYPNLKENETRIVQEIEQEEERFRLTLEKGIKEFNLLPGPVISGPQAALLYQTYGFPVEVTEELAREKGFVVDRAAYEEEMEKHQELSRAGSEKKFKGGLAGHSDKEVQYHTATHLLHQALRTVLGGHVLQRGSNITPERLRFDFAHSQKMTDEEKKKVEDLINQKIREALPVFREEMPLEEARKMGAIGLFGEKYGDVVSIYRIGNGNDRFSLEFCGGPHVTNTSELKGTFKIAKEEAVSAGVRRIKAVLE
jgi:alanyl-tRNA synthetase